MYTQCPHCSTVFPLSPALLAQGRGMLQCGVCGETFDALERLAERPELIDATPPPSEPVLPRVDAPATATATDIAATEPTGAQAPLWTDAPAAPAPTTPIAEPEPEPEPLPAQTIEQPSEPPRSARSAAATPTAPPPSFARRRAVITRPRRTALWAGAAMLLLLLLGLQIVLAQRVEFAADARWRPWLVQLCERLGCTLPAWHDPQRLTLVSREIGPHPSVPNALLVTATLRNDAPWPQAWPLFELTLSDLEGQPVGLRRFRADEYLGAPPERPTIAPGQSALARLEIADPGKQAVAFTFDFH